jgi:hypothetical protein
MTGLTAGVVNVASVHTASVAGTTLSATGNASVTVAPATTDAVVLAGTGGALILLLTNFGALAMAVGGLTRRFNRRR